MTDSLRERLGDDLKSAMRAGNVTARETIRFTLSGLKYEEIEKRRELTREEEVAFLQRQAKRLNEAIDLYRAGDRPDLAEREAAQLAILEGYLPAALTDDEVRTIVEQAIAETGASSAKEMGKVMPIAIARAAGRADGKRLSAAVREALAQST
ncbi:MAG: GatB/YqeY domain-containing protein [Thermomicrobiales bacterium]